jgi:hypothetical protein
MSQVTLYIEPDTLTRARAAAKARGVSLSRWVSDALRQQTARDWSPEFRAAAGAWADMETARPAEPTDIPRRTW